MMSLRSTSQRVAHRTASALRYGYGCRRVTGYRTFATVVEPIQKDPADLDKIVRLPNGIRVVTEDLPGHFSGIGVYIEAGSRLENDYLRGVSHIMDRLAFKSTTQRSGDQMLEDIESLGGQIQCASSRESLMYQAASFNSKVPTTVALLAEAIRDPLVTEEEVAQQLQTAKYEVGEIWAKPELIVPELIHMAAYKDNTLGNPLLCPKDRLDQIDRKTILAYRQAFFDPKRIVIAFAGVKHDEAMRLAEKHFGDMQPAGAQEAKADISAGSARSPPAAAHLTTASQRPSSLMSKVPFLKNISTSASRAAAHASDPQSLLLPDEAFLSQPSRYTGGFLSLPPIPPSFNPQIPPLTHIQIAFESFAINSPQIYALAALQTLLGGGGSFSAGGPGKGMYSRLYTNVLNQHGWVENCLAYNSAYTDSGLFGIAASCSPKHAARMVDVICQELHALTLDIGPTRLQEDEVARAKKQLRSQLLMNLESRMVGLEDLGRQVQVHGRKVGAREMCAQIEALTVADLRATAREVLTGMRNTPNPGRGAGGPTVVLQESEDKQSWRGELEWDEVQDRIERWDLGAK